MLARNTSLHLLRTSLEAWQWNRPVGRRLHAWLHRRAVVACMVLWACCALESLAAAQYQHQADPAPPLYQTNITYAPDGATVLGEYPFGSSWAIASENNPTGPDLIVAGSGAGLLVFETESLQGATPTQFLRAGGMVRDIVITPAGQSNRVYAAAGRKGVTVFERGSWLEDFTDDLSLPNAPAYERAHALAVVHVSAGRDIVCVGTNNGASGRLLIYDTSLPFGSELVRSYDLLRPLQALAATTELYANRITLFGASVCRDLFVLQIDTQTVPLNLSNSPLQVKASLAGRYPRDLALHLTTTPSTKRRLYLAQFEKGVAAFDIQLNSSPETMQLTELTSASGWPWKPADGSGVPYTNFYCYSVAVDALSSRLVVGMGPKLAGEAQYSPGCEGAYPQCFGVNRDLEPEVSGAYFLDVGGAFGAAFIASVVDDGIAQSPVFFGVSMAYRKGTTSEFTVDWAGQMNGFYEAEALLGPTGWDASYTRFDENDSLPLNTNDGILVQDNTLYSSTERMITAYDLSASVPLETLGGVAIDPKVFNPALPEAIEIGIAGFQEPDSRLYTLGVDQFAIADTDSALPNPKVNPVLSPVRSIGGDCRLAATMTGLRPANSNEPLSRWLVTPLLQLGNVPESAGGLIVWDVGTATDPTNIQQVGNPFTFTDCSTCKTKFFDVDIRPILGNSSQALVYCNVFKERLQPGSTTAKEGTFGLLRVRMVMPAVQPGQPPILRFVDPVFVDALPTNVPTGLSGSQQIWNITYDPFGSRIFAAVACHGVAAYQDFDGITPPTFLGLRSDLPGVAFDLVRGPDLSLYVSLMEYGIAIIPDVNNITSGSVTIVPTRFQALGLALDPTAALARDRLYVADTQAGVLRLEFDATLFP